MDAYNNIISFVNNNNIQNAQLNQQIQTLQNILDKNNKISLVVGIAAGVGAGIADLVFVSKGVGSFNVGKTIGVAVAGGVAGWMAANAASQSTNINQVKQQLAANPTAAQAAAIMNTQIQFINKSAANVLNVANELFKLPADALLKDLYEKLSDCKKKHCGC